MAIGRFNLSLTGVQPGGLVYIGGTTFSGASSVSINDVFTSTYRNYKIMCDLTASVDNQIRFRLRENGSDITSTSYYYGLLAVGVGASAAFSATNNVAADTMAVTNVGAGAGGFTMDLLSPQLAQRKSALSLGTGRVAYWSSYNIQVTNQCDGFTVYPPGSTITGSISVYGYRNDNN